MYQNDWIKSYALNKRYETNEKPNTQEIVQIIHRRKMKQQRQIGAKSRHQSLFVVGDYVNGE